ncbi:MAG: caspase family protein [Myxococcales bacterium]|nr:MAG: caspase family protein [Myxococcales bacterium]
MSARRALLFGSQTHGLRGPDADAERMREALSRHQFTTKVCTGARATRDGMLEAYEKLIAETQSNDAVCIYYSGHGGRLANPFARGPRFLQYLVPTDHAAGAFRGLMSFELSALLARLTLKTTNVTVILDCCHAGQMSRAARPAPSAGSVRLVAKVFEDGLTEEQVGKLLEGARSRDRTLEPESNWHAVRLLATEPHVSAYEAQGGTGAGGIFTEALLAVLAERGERRASWGSVMLEARERVMLRKSEQRPDVEGPRRRVLFRTEQLPDERPLPLFFQGSEARLRAGSLFGAVPGARYGLMPAGSEVYEASRSVGEALVTQTLGSTARLEVHGQQARSLPGSALLAFPLRPSIAPCLVGLDDELRAELAAVLERSRYVRTEPLRGGSPLPTIARIGSELTLRDAGGVLLARGPKATPEWLLERLECLARAQDLRSLARGGLETDLQVELGRVERGRRVPLDGKTLHVGERQYISVKNCGSQTVFLALLGIDPLYTVRLLTRRAPRGHWLRAGQALVLGEAPDGSLTGVTATWPAPLAAERPLGESVIVIAAEEEQDFSLLTTSDAYDLRLRDAQPPLPGREQTERRGSVLASEPRSEYAVCHHHYELDPRPRPT